MKFKVSEVKRPRAQRFTLEEPKEEEEEEKVLKKPKAERERTESVELEPSPEKIKEEEIAEFWKESALASQFRPITLTPLAIDEEGPFEEAEEEEEEEEEQRRPSVTPPTLKWTDADMEFRQLPLDAPVQLPPLQYVETNGQLNSFLQHNLWWAGPAGFDKLVIQNPQRLSDRDDKQFEAMIRLAEQASRRTLKNDPGSVPKPVKKRLDRAEVEMRGIVSGAHRRVNRKIAEPGSASQRPFDLNSITFANLAGKRHFRELKEYHEPQLGVSHERSFLQSLDKLLLHVPDPEQIFTKEVAREQLTVYLKDLQTLEHVDSFLISPVLSLVKPRFSSRDGLITDAHLVDLDHLELHKFWSPVQQQLEQRKGHITPELWRDIVLRAISSGTLLWEGTYWSLELAELLLRYMQLALAIMQLYDDVVASIELQVDDEVSRGQLEKSLQEDEVENRIHERGMPLVLDVRVDPYSLGAGEELLDEMVMNAFYGMEHDAAGVLTPIVQEAGAEGEEEEELGLEPMRLLPLFQPDLVSSMVEKVTDLGAASFDRDNYTAGTYNYVTKLLITRRQADLLGSSNLDQKVLRFRAQLVSALERYREMNKRTPFRGRMPGFIGHDLNTIMCKLAIHLREATEVDVSLLLKTAVAAFPLQHLESRRSKRIAEFLFYFALAEKMFLFDDNYLERPLVEFEKREEEEMQLVKQKRVMQFLDVAAEEAEADTEGEEEEDEVEAAAAAVDVTLEVRRSLMEKRLLRVAAELFTGSNSLNRFKASKNPDKRKVVSEGALLEQQYGVGLNTIKEKVTDQFEEYQTKWERVSKNVQTIRKEGGWPLEMSPEQQDPNATQRESKQVLLRGRQIVDSIPFREDAATAAALVQVGFRNAFYSAISVRDLLERGRGAVSNSPPSLSTPFPLIVERSSGVDVKQRALRVAVEFLLSGYVLPSNVDSLAAGLTLIQLMRVLELSGEVILSLLVPLVEGTFVPTTELTVPEEQFACAMTLACLKRDIALFQHLLYYASVQDIRTAGVLTLQIDYWLLETESTALVDDIKTELVEEFLRQVLRQDQVETYNESVDQVNRIVQEKVGQPPLLRHETDTVLQTETGEERRLYDYMLEPDYESLTLDQLRTQLPTSVIYTPWMSSLKTMRLYLQYRNLSDQEEEERQALCDFIEKASGTTLNRYYRHNGCDREVIIDMRADEGLSPLTFTLLERYSLLYEDENYDTKLEAVMAYFSMTSKTILALDKAVGTTLLNKSQEPAWNTLVRLLKEKPTPKNDTEAEALLGQVIDQMTLRDQKMLVPIFQAQTQSNLRELQVGTDNHLHIARSAKQPYEGYILLHTRLNLEGEQVIMYTPIYPKYRRMLQRLLVAIRTAEKNNTHWLDEWSPQYRPRVILSMNKKEEKWVAVGRSVESGLTLKDMMGSRRFEGIKDLFRQPPIRPGKQSDEFLGYGKSSKDKDVLAFRQQLKLITHLMELPQEFSGLAMLNFFIPDTRTANVYDLTHFAFAMETMQSLSVIRNISSESGGLKEYLQTHTPMQTERDVLQYVQTVRTLFQKALKDLNEGNVTAELKQVADIYAGDVSDPELTDDITHGLDEITNLEGFVAALRYPFNQPPSLHDDHVIVNHIIPELTTHEPAVQRVSRDVYQAAFLKSDYLTIPGAQTKRSKPRTRIVEEEEEEEEMTMMEIEPEREVMQIIEEEERQLSPEMRELMESMEAE